LRASVVAIFLMVYSKASSSACSSKEAAYRRGDLFAKRAQMMQEWADFLDKMERKGSLCPKLDKGYSQIL